MNKRDARALGRYCEKHKQVHRRIHMDNGAHTTMCPDCASDPEFKRAMDAMVEACWEWFNQKAAKQ